VIVGRDRELAVIARLLDGVVDGPAVLAVLGAAGIGKTTVWGAGLAAAQTRGFRVLVCRAAAAEVRLSYAGLTDLLGDVSGDDLAWLPGPQRRALDAALLREVHDKDFSDPRSVAAGFLAVLEHLAGRCPVLVAVDDVQWLDEPTRQVITFAVRRCRGPVVTLTTRCIGAGSPRCEEIWPRDPARLWRLDVGPLNPSVLHHVLIENVGRSFPRPVLLRIARTSGGNPYYAVEIARSLDLRDSAPPVFPDSLRAVVGDHIRSLEPRVQDALLVVSALAAPSLDLVGRACGGANAVDLLGTAEDSGVVEFSGGYARFTHPLLADGVYSETSPTKRRALHRNLSELVDDVEERARHLALAVTGPEADAVNALDVAAAQARRRGAVSAAAELLELAIGLGANDPMRRVQAAQDHFHADDPLRARDMLQEAITELSPGPQRAAALATLGTILYEIDDYSEAIETLQQAYDDAGNDLQVRSEIAMDLIIALGHRGRMGEAISYTERAERDSEQAGDTGLLAEVLSVSQFNGFLSGKGIDDAALERALALEDPQRRSHAIRWPSMGAAMLHIWTHRLDDARSELAALRRRCLERGLESDVALLAYHATYVALWSGDVGAAQILSRDATDRALMVSADHPRALGLATQALVWAWTGQVEQARAACEEAVAILTKIGMTAGVMWVMSTLGMLTISVGDHEAAVRWLVPAAAAAMEGGLGEPVCFPFLPDAAEALIGLGRLDEAELLVQRLEVSGGGPDRVWAQAVGARTRGLLAAARGDLDAAVLAFGRALAAHDRLPLRYERARTLLALGQLQRRRNERRAARASLEEAVGLFDAVGTTRWADNARAELGRLGARPGPAEELTKTQERVAELAARGLTNREVAAALIISPKTVEANLSRVYQKLGIRSRAQLGAWLAQRRTEDHRTLPGA
jgi:DNA-binding CsgD family transcriptional regulator